MKTKQDFEAWYSKENPWGFNNTIIDKVRRKIVIYHINKLIDKNKKIIMLDCGCGEGYITKDISENFNVEIDAFDISDRAIEFAKNNNNHKRINYFQADLNNFQPNKKYDLIICEEVLYYLNDEERKIAVKKIHNSLKINGVFKISVVVIGENKYKKYFTLNSINTLIYNSAFQIHSIKPTVLKKSGFLNKIIDKLIDKTNFSFLLRMKMSLVLINPLNKCYQVSILSKKLYNL